MIFVDTSFWVAASSERDPYNATAKQLSEGAARAQLVTSNFVRGETWTFLNRRFGHSRALQFLNSFDLSPQLRLVRVSEQLEREAIAWLRVHDEREYSYVDATSFALMRSLKIRTAFAFDGDFSAAGFVELRP